MARELSPPLSGVTVTTPHHNRLSHSHPFHEILSNQKVERTLCAIALWVLNMVPAMYEMPKRY